MGSDLSGGFIDLSGGAVTISGTLGVDRGGRAGSSFASLNPPMPFEASSLCQNPSSISGRAKKANT